MLAHGKRFLKAIRSGNLLFSGLPTLLFGLTLRTIRPNLF